MPGFEKVPREVRDLIFEYCLLYNGEIVPFPSGYERTEIEGRLQVSISKGSLLQRTTVNEGGRHAFLGYPYVKRGAFQTKHQPCVALLGVNSMIRDEAASILFGKNVWRLSSRSYGHDDSYCLWTTYASYFRHIVTKFDYRNFDEVQLLDITMMEIDCVEEDSDHFDPAGTANIHQGQLSLLRDNIAVKRDILIKMNLQSLSFDFPNLFCSSGCCRRDAIQSCLISLGPTGPWFMLGREGYGESETKQRTDVKTLGLKNDNGRKLLLDIWGLKVD